MKKLALGSMFLAFTMYSGFSFAQMTAADELAQGSAKGSIELVAQALENGADPNARDIFGKTPLFNAVINGHDLVVSLLIANGAQIDAKDILGRTPLHRAAMEGNLSTVKLLVAKGAETDLPDYRGFTPVDNAASHFQVETVDYLMEA